MSGDRKKYEHLAGVCDYLAQTAPTPEQRKTFEELAGKWRVMATNQNLYEVAPSTAHRSTVRGWLSGLRKAPASTID
jgi:hypothetical protein